MSRVAKQPVPLPKGVEATVSGTSVTIKGQKSTLTLVMHPHVNVVNDKGALHVSVK